MLASLALATALITPAYQNVDPSDIAAVNAINTSGTGAMVCVNPVDHAMLSPDDKETTDLETPLGRVDSIAKDISFIKNAVTTGKEVGQATVEVATNDKSFSWYHLAVGALIGFCVCLASKIWSKTTAFFSAVNAVLKQVDDNKKESK